jgi:hypothetical protein
MSQIDFIRDTVSDFFDALIASDLADAGTLQIGDADPVPCRVLIKRGASPFGDFGRPTGDKISVRIVTEGDILPVIGATITVVSVALGTEVFTLTELINDDGALTDWQVQRA